MSSRSIQAMENPALASKAALRCPGCAAALTPETFATQPIDRCPAGHGVWLDDGELASALRTVVPK